MENFIFLPVLSFILIGNMDRYTCHEASGLSYHQLALPDISTSCEGNQSCSQRDCRMTGPFEPTSVKYFKCDCHIDCYQRGTCCMNFEEVCLTDSALSTIDVCLNVELKEMVEAARKRKESKELFDDFMAMRQKRVIMKKVESQNVDYYMVVGCPACTDKPSDLVAKCQLEVLFDVKQLMAVTAGGTLYRNVYCFECHRSNLSLIAETVLTKIECADQVRGKAIDFYRNNNIKGILEMVANGECSEHYPSIVASRASVEKRWGTDMCPKENALLLPNFREISAACASYSAYVYFDSPELRRDQPFKNSHCVLCNNFDIKYAEPEECICYSRDTKKGINCTILEKGRDLVLDYNDLFRVALDFTGSPELKLAVVPTCNNQTEEVNMVERSCEERICPKDYINVGSTCLHTHHIRLAALDAQFNPSAEICAGLQNTRSLDIKSPGFSEKFTNIIWKSEFSIHDHDIDVSSQQPCFNVPSPDMVGLRMEPDYNSFTPEAYLAMLFNILSDFKVIMNDLDSIQIESLKVVMNSDMICTGDNYQRLTVVDPAMIWLGMPGSRLEAILLEPRENVKLYDRNSGIIANPARQAWALEVSKNEEEWKSTLLWEVCMKVDKECLNASSRENCTQADKIVRGAEKKLSALQWKAWLSFLLCIVSVLSLIVTICVHSLFPSIMKGGGRTFLSLIASLLGADVCMLFSGFTIWSPLVCSVIAAVQHLTWLSAFTWTAIMSWNLYQALVQLESNTADTFRWPIYCLVGWGCPLIICSVCVGLHLVGLFQYGSESVCWISDSLQLGVSFGLPVALVITINGVLYVITAETLRKRLRESNRLGRDVSMKSKLALYIKLSSIVGFPWIFGFLANIEGLAFLKHVFSISAALNGTFVAICFTMNSRSIQMMRLGVQSRNGPLRTTQRT